jgi:hypothetical protein
MIAGHAGPDKGPTSPLLVQAVLRICKKMNKRCKGGG